MLACAAASLCVAATTPLCAQTSFDAFTDGDFTATPIWSGNTSAWSIVNNSDVATGASGSNTLRLAAATVAGSDYLCSQVASWGSAQEWGFWLGRRAQAYTASNQVQLWLYANESNLASATVDGFRIAIGDDSGGDDIRLEYVVNGSVAATVISSSAAIPNGLTDIGILLRVTRSLAGNWELFTSALPAANGGGETATVIPNSTNAAVSQGTGINNMIIPSANGYLGILAVHTSGSNAIAAVELDQVYFTSTAAPAATVVLSSATPAVASAVIVQNSTNQVIYKFGLDVSSADATLTGVSISTSGTYQSSDIINLKCWYSADDQFNAGSDLLLATKTEGLGAGSHSFPSFNAQSILSGASAYIFITTDLPCTATDGATLSVLAITTADLSFVSANTSGSTNAGGTQTTNSATPANASGFSSVAGDQTVQISWNNPAGCLDDVLVTVATASNTAAPSGDGGSYLANLAYSSGTAIGNGFVVYKGTTSPQTVTGLTNGVTYYFKIFSRNDQVWSSGIEISSTPVQSVAAGEILINQFSPDYGGATDEYIELVNTTSRSIDLSALKIAYQSAAGSSSAAGGNLSGIIPANGFWLLSTNAVVTAGLSNLNRDGSISSGFATSGQIALQRTADNLKIDGLAYGTITQNNLGEGINSAAAPTDGGLKRQTDGADSNVNNTDFTTVTNATINVRNSSSRLLNAGATLPAGNYTALSVTSNSTLAADASVVALTLSAGSSLSIGANTLTITGAISGSGSLTGSAVSNLVITGAAGNIGFSTGGQVLKNLTLGNNASVTLSTALSVTAGTAAGVLSVGENATLNTAGLLLIRSDANGTARVAAIGSGGNINGNVTVERYLPAKRAWRLICAPLNNSESIFDSWQNSGNYITGNGILITGSSANPATNGLDASTSNPVSMYAYNQAANSWTAVTNTRTTLLSANNGYLVFVRGDRNPANLSASATANNTTVDATGQLHIGDLQFSTNSNANGFTLLANPYASPVDFDLLYSDPTNGGTSGNTNIQRKFWTWDPNLGDRGGYVTVSHNGNDYDVVPAGGSTAQTQHLQSGQAFFVQSNATGTAQLTFKEAHKSAGNINNVFREGAQFEKIIINLSWKNSGGSYLPVDGALLNFHNGFDRGVNAQDAMKLAGFDECLAFKRLNHLLSIEAHPLAEGGDTFFLYTGNLKQRQYRFTIQPKQFNAAGVSAWLLDKHLGTATAISLYSSTQVDFIATADASSRDTDRFKLVFRNNAPLPALQILLRAYPRTLQVVLEWKTTFSETVKYFEAGKSSDGINFSKTCEIAATGTVYRWTDSFPSAINFYRVTAITTNGQRVSSNILRHQVSATADAFLYPNPFNRAVSQPLVIHLPRGARRMRIVNMAGNIVFHQILNYATAGAVTSLRLPANLSPGCYTAVLHLQDGSIRMQQILIR